MPFLGIITNQKNEEYMKKMLSDYFPIDHIIYITEKNIANIKNVRFETILIDKNISYKEEMKRLISNAKYIILNSDLMIDLKILEDLNLNVITYGFNNKATFTVSSITESDMIICLQRIIYDIFNDKYEPQEFELKTEENIDITAIMGQFCVRVLYVKK